MCRFGSSSDDFYGLCRKSYLFKNFADYCSLCRGNLFFINRYFRKLTMMIVGQLALALFLAILLGLGISYFQDLLPQFPGYASALFANAMIIGQLLGNLLGGFINDLLGVENAFYFSAAFLFTAFILFFFTKKEVREGEI